MSIATEITALQNDKTAIADAITAKGGTVVSGDGFDDFAADIASIPSGGGGTTNVKTFRYTLAEATTSVTFVSGDADVAAHYSSSSACCMVCGSASIYSGTTAQIGSIKGNSNIAKFSGSPRKGFTFGGAGCSNAASGLSSTPSSGTTGVFANANGDILWYGSNLLAGDYVICFWWAA